MVNSKTEFIKRLFESLNENQLDYFVIGEYNDLPESNGNSDLDIIIPFEHVDDLLFILNELLLQYNIKVVSYYSNSNAKFYRLLCESETFWGLQLDLFCKGLFFQTKEYFPIAELKNDLLVYNDIKVLNLKKAYFIGFLKEIIHKGWAKDKYIEGFITEVLSDESKYRELLTRLYGEKFTKIIFENLSIDHLKIQTKVLGNIMLKKVYFGNVTWFFKNFEKIKYLKRILQQPGFSIVFLGEDDSSKMRIIDKVTSILNESFHNSVYNEQRYNLFTSISRMKEGDTEAEKINYKRDSQKTSAVIQSLYSFFIYLFDFTKRYWIKIFPKKAFHSCIWLFDSYHYDYINNSNNQRNILKKWILKTIELILPSPDIIIYVGANSKLFLNKTSQLSKFREQHPKTIWIDTECSLEQSVDNTIRAISNVMVKRFKTFNQFSKVD